MTLRARLTLVYGVLFLVAGAVLLALIYALVYHQVIPGIYYRLDTSPSSPSDAPTVGAISQLPGIPVNPNKGDLAQQLLHEAHASLMSSLVHRGAIALLLVAAVAIGLGWVIAGRALRPLQRVTETARRIASGPVADHGLQERIALAGPQDEVKELADTFDAMLRRLDASFDAQRRFVANASHELRTPLTLNRALIEVAMRRKTASADLRQLGETLLEVNLRHERMINGLLVLARSQAELTEHTSIDLATITEHVVGQTRPEAAAAAVSLSAQTAPATTVGDPVLLERLVQNLIQNGVRHNVAEDGWVRVDVAPGPDGRATLTVTNTGAIISAEKIPALFEPFRRFGRDRLDTRHGAGLGLSIVRSVASAHSGDVSVVPRDGGGLVVHVTLPAVPATAP